MKDYYFVEIQKDVNIINNIFFLFYTNTKH
jgi:hypothetical protein